MRDDSDSDYIEELAGGSSRFNIAREGDIILVVEGGRSELRVHSQCLGWASKVFRAMFGPHWAEGQNLSAESPKRIDLEDESPGMHDICCVLHHRNDQVMSSTPIPTLVFQYAIVTDKYDLHSALGFASIEWLKSRDRATMTDVAYLMAAAYLFRDHEAFGRHALNLILNHTGSYLKLIPDEKSRRRLPSSTFYVLEEQRNEIRADINDILIGESNQYGCCSSKVSGYPGLRADFGGTGLLKASLSTIIARLKTARSPPLQHCILCIDAFTFERIKSRQTYFSQKWLEKAKKKATLCFQCLEEGESRRPCRVSKHIK